MYLRAGIRILEGVQRRLVGRVEGLVAHEAHERGVAADVRILRQIIQPRAQG